MKKIFKVSMICVLALASITGCKKETFRLGESIVFRAGTTATKAAYSGVVTDGVERIDWVSGDLVRISCEQASAPASKWADYKTNGGTAEGSVSKSFLAPAEASGLLWGTGTHEFYAVYPSPATSSSAVTAMDGDDVTACVPAVQTVSVADPVEGSYTTTPDLSKSMLMVAYNAISAEDYEKGGVLLNFQPVTTALEFTITNSTEADLEVADIYLTSENHPLSGAYTATIGTDGSVTVVAAGDAGKAAMAEPATAFTVANGKTFRITVFLCPQDNLDDLVFHITSSDGKERYTKLRKSNGDIVTFKKSIKTYVSGLFVPAGAVWQVSYDSDVDSWDDIDGGDVDLTDPSLEMGDMFVTSWDEVDKGDPGLHFAPEPVCFTAASAQTVIFDRVQSTTTPAELYYSYDRMNWTRWENTGTNALTFGESNATRSLYIKGNNSSFCGADGVINTEYPAFSFGDQAIPVAASGNIMSLVNSVDAKTTIPSYNMFYGFFYNQTCLTSTPELPATTLRSHCYSYMFYGCSNLTDVCDLPAEVLEYESYAYMFYGCSSLTDAPRIYAVKVNSYGACSYMFQNCVNLVYCPDFSVTEIASNDSNAFLCTFSGCVSLTKAPALPATKLGKYCYQKMFQGCTSLVDAPALPSETLSFGCYYNMFLGCTSLVNAPELPATTMTEKCYQYMFSGCTSLVNAPVLPATTLANGCYREMFRGCTSLSSIKMLATDISATDCLYLWTYNVAGAGTFVKAAGVEIPSGNSGIPENWTVVEVSE